MATVIDGSASVTINSGAVLGITSGTAVASTSGTSIDFTSIPSWVKRLTVMFQGVSTSGSSYVLIRIGAGSVDTTSYTGITAVGWSGIANYSDTSGFPLYYNTNTYTLSGAMVLTTIGSNIWVISGTVAMTGLNGVIMTGGSKTLSSTLDRVRITTVNGTDTFDAGSINILYEG